MTAAPIPQKVANIIPLLGSATDPEALSACRAIGRVLARSGLGFSDLATAIRTGNLVDNVHEVHRPAALQPPRAAGPRPFDVYAFRRAYTPRQEAAHRAQVRFCLSRPSRLTPWEHGFLDNVARLRGNLSVHQGDQLAGIVDRLELEARRAC